MTRPCMMPGCEREATRWIVGDNWEIAYLCGLHCIAIVESDKYLDSVRPWGLISAGIDMHVQQEINKHNCPPVHRAPKTEV
jgi:hypothetical protein